MIYLQIAGRLGNQLFQYAFARYVKHITKDEIFIDFSLLPNEPENGYEDSLKYFNVSSYHIGDTSLLPKWMSVLIRIISKTRPRNLLLKSIYERITNPLLQYIGIFSMDSDNFVFHFNIKKKKVIFIKGWFESDKYFLGIAEILRKEITPRSPLSVSDISLIKYLRSTESICLTIRRGNFITDASISARFNVCNSEYFKKGVEYIRKIYPNSPIYICSDDNEWCRNNLIFNGEVIFEKDNLSLSEKLAIMSSCRHFVISNSTFSWWAQFLSDNNDKIVIAPKVWRKEFPQPKAIRCSNWIYLS